MAAPRPRAAGAEDASEHGPANCLSAANAAADAFTDRFNACDLAGTDAPLHFPHVILSGERLIVWDGPGRMPPAFFEGLARTTGWARTLYVEWRAVLVNAR